jgi:hypothetical protein
VWAKGPHVNARQFAAVENAKRVVCSLHAALSIEASPTPTGTAAALQAPSPYGRLSCHDTPNRSPSQPNRRLKP